MEMPFPLDHGKTDETKLENGSVLHGTQEEPKVSFSFLFRSSYVHSV
jgi:hypothetical protein